MKVYISYTHDSPEHMRSVRELADKLRADGIEAYFDQYEPAHKPDWSQWRRDQLKEADCVLIIASHGLVDGWMETGPNPVPGDDSVNHEMALIYSELFSEKQGLNLVAVHLSEISLPRLTPSGWDQIPHFLLYGYNGYYKLYRFLTHQPMVTPPPVGKVKALPTEWMVEEDAFGEILQPEIPEKLISGASKETFHTDQGRAQPFSIRRLEVRNFQCIQSASITEVPMDNRWIFVLGENGDGKTSLLQALTIGLCGYEGATSLLRDSECHVEVEFQIQSVSRRSFFSAGGRPPKRPSNFLAYGPSRLQVMGDNEEERGPVESLQEQKGALKSIDSWMLLQTLEIGHTQDPNLQAQLTAVQKVLVELMPHVSEIEIKGKRVLYHEKGHVTDIHQLSAGHKSIVAMIGDLLIRLFEMQPHVLDPSDLMGVVLIDELENHLHPRWQAVFVGMLSKIFPKIQFIASTHSPLVFISAPLESLYLKMTRSPHVGSVVEQIDIDVTTLLPNTILSSPLFDLEQLINTNLKDLSKLDTADHFKTSDYRKHINLALKTMNDNPEISLEDYLAKVMGS